MNQYLRSRFSVTPKGFWLAERVWEQRIARLANQSGLQFTALDDTHFALAGLAESEIRDFFITEEEGFPLYLFPIPKFLRYAIPFQEPSETLGYLQKMESVDSRPPIVTYADDGEKFGLWPGTYQWVYREGWLNRFAEMIEENRSWLILKTFSEILEESKPFPAKKVYLPTASYEEMTEWSLNRKKARDFASLRRELESSAAWDRARFFFQGGTFKNFLAKYPESDWMKSKMEWVSRRVNTVTNPARKRKAEQELWQGQCNCPYWHGVFGGLYLHHLRRSTYEHLIRAELASGGERKGIKTTEEDLNHDGVCEIVVETAPFGFYFLPHQGGSLAELDYRPQTMNVLDTLSRWEEAYHQDLVQNKSSQGGKGKSIHELERAVSPEVFQRMAFDAWRRLSFLDLFLSGENTMADLWKGHFTSFGGDPTRVVYLRKWRTEKGRQVLSLAAKLPWKKSSDTITLEKSVEFHPREENIGLSWKITNTTRERIDCIYGSEWNLNFFAREREEREMSQVEVQDGWSTVCLKISGSASFDYWQFPIETVAQTETTFRLIHQGISVFPHWRLSLDPGESFSRRLNFSFLGKS